MEEGDHGTRSMLSPSTNVLNPNKKKKTKFGQDKLRVYEKMLLVFKSLRLSTNVGMIMNKKKHEAEIAI